MPPIEQICKGAAIRTLSPNPAAILAEIEREAYLAGFKRCASFVGKQEDLPVKDLLPIWNEIREECSRLEALQPKEEK